MRTVLLASAAPPPPPRRTMTVAQLLAFAETLTPGQLAVLGLNVRADGSLSDHGRAS